MNIESVAKFSSQQSYINNKISSIVITPTEFISKAKVSNDRNAYVEVSYKGSIIENIMIDLDDFLVSILCDTEQGAELKKYEIDEFFDVFGYDNFDIIWHIKE